MLGTESRELPLSSNLNRERLLIVPIGEVHTDIGSQGLSFKHETRTSHAALQQADG